MSGLWSLIEEDIGENSQICSFAHLDQDPPVFLSNTTPMLPYILWYRANAILVFQMLEIEVQEG